LTHSISKNQYINNPCRVCSTAFWKNFFQKPDTIQIIHENDISSIDIATNNVTRYFRFIHNLENINTDKLNDRYYLQTVKIPSQNEKVSKIINSSYDNMDITVEQVTEWTKYNVFNNDLWIFIIDKIDLCPIALGIADFDNDIKEGSLEWIQVLPEFRGLGLGQAIVNELLIRLKDRADFVTVSGQLDTVTNPEFLYRKCGFTGDDVWCVISPINEMIFRGASDNE